MSVQWFPGHMTKAIRQIEQRIAEVDMVIECRDARIPFSSSNPVIDKIIGNKPRLIVLTKKDLSLPSVTQDWVKELEQEETAVVVLNILKDNVNRHITNGCLKAMKAKHDRDLARGIKPRIIRALIMGVPNVGKSTLMNRLSQRRVADVSNRPGVTRALKKVKVSDKLEVIDSPGLLWPKFDDIRIGYHLALCLSVKETGFRTDDVIRYGLDGLSQLYLDKIQEYYGVDSLEDLEVVKEAAALKRSQPSDRGAQIILADITNHRFGPMSWENYDTFRDAVLEEE